MLGCFGDHDAAVFQAVAETALAAGAEADVPVGTLGATPPELRSLGELGFDFLVAGADFAHLIEGQRRAVGAAADVL